MSYSIWIHKVSFNDLPHSTIYFTMGDIFYNLLAVNNLKFICKNITANRIGLQQKYFMYITY